VSVALDASALLAFLFGEPGHEQVAAVIDDCELSTVNLAEVISRFARDGHDPGPVYRQIAGWASASFPSMAKTQHWSPNCCFQPVHWVCRSVIELASPWLCGVESRR
jgi:predicted nucleic acid-binding protein